MVYYYGNVLYKNTENHRKGHKRICDLLNTSTLLHSALPSWSYTEWRSIGPYTHIVRLAYTIFILALHEIGEQLHEARERWGIGKNCPCKRKEELEDTATIKELPDDDKNVVDEKPSLLEEGKHCIGYRQNFFFLVQW